ncbi:MAG: UDP-N-acetylmuramoyl-L-alanyl-D-glutamate--2,6-diaminopimelate ligase [Deltaproteobacteria bacterium]|nr:MAG: UDP-N-acetylmuramoyl-L-alanyl-D-glutamate--2,6-diaminopimelate ligase [Deltaproteobacteria bacterium]
MQGLLQRGVRVRVAEFVKVLGVDADFPLPDAEVRGIAVDSREVRDGDVFFALPGTREHGIRYLNDALTRGALLCVTDEAPPGGKAERVILVPDAMDALCRASSHFYGNPSSSLTVVGVTGTNGKTTISYLLESIFESAGFRTGVVGTVNYRVGGKLIREGLTTPFPHQLQGALAEMRDCGARYSVVEVSSHGLAQGRVRGIEFSAAVFTNLSRDHLDYHGDMESYYSAKKRLFVEHLRGGDALSVVNVDCPYGKRLAGEAGGRVVTCSLKGEGDFTAESALLTIGGIDANLRWGGGSLRVRSSLVGRHNLENILLASACALSLGIPPDRVEEGIEALKSVPGRLERVKVKQGAEFFVDYAHTPDGLRNVVEALIPFRTGRLIVVFGCGGDRDRGKRPIMGEVVASRADVTVVTSDNPRSEDPRAIIDEILPGCERAGAVRVSSLPGNGPGRVYLVEPDRRKAIGLAVDMARPGDIVLVAGKGHETYQIIGQERIEFDDRAVLREYGA